MMHYKYIRQERLEDLIRMKVSLSKRQLLLSKTNTLNRRREREREQRNEILNSNSHSWLEAELEVRL